MRRARSNPDPSGRFTSSTTTSGWVASSCASPSLTPRATATRWSSARNWSAMTAATRASSSITSTVVMAIAEPSHRRVGPAVAPGMTRRYALAAIALKAAGTTGTVPAHLVRPLSHGSPSASSRVGGPLGGHAWRASRSARSSASSTDGSSPSASSAAASPTTGANLNPCPENPAHATVRSSRRSTIGCSSGVIA